MPGNAGGAVKESTVITIQDLAAELTLTTTVKLLEEIDTEAERRGSTRAEEIRRRLQAMSRL